MLATQVSNAPPDLPPLALASLAAAAFTRSFGPATTRPPELSRSNGRCHLLAGRRLNTQQPPLAQHLMAEDPPHAFRS